MRRALLVCGVLSTMTYLAADVLGSLQWEGYSYVDQTISELAAIDAPSRPVVMPLFVAYGILLFACAAGVAMSGRAKPLRGAAAMLATIGALGVAGYFFPIHTRAAAWTINETMHSVLTGLTVVAILIGMGYTAMLGPRFRIYSFVTIALTFGAGALGGWIGRGLASDQPTPWVGIVERVSVFSYLLWVAVLSIALLRQAPVATPHGASRRAA